MEHEAKKEISLDEILAILGAKEVELLSLRRQLIEARAEMLKLRELQKGKSA